jgi:hypothetical protein
LGLSRVSYDEEDHHHHRQDDFEDDEREKEDDEVDDDDDGGRREDDDDDKEDIIEIIVFNGIDFVDGRVFASNRRRGDHPTVVVVVKYVAGRARVANRKGVLPAPGRERHPDDERRRCRRRSGARSKIPWTKRRRDFIDEFFTTSFFF